MCESCRWAQALDLATALKDDPDKKFARDTVTGIWRSISLNEHVTGSQQRSLYNIRDARRPVFNDRS